MATRRAARRPAIDVLYQADVTGTDPLAVLGDRAATGTDVDPFARALVEGVVANRPELDDALSAHAEHWTLERMASLDRTILRLAAFELLHGEVPPGVAISEAVEIANELSTEDSGRFVNGILGRIYREAASTDGPRPGAEPGGAEPGGVR